MDSKVFRFALLAVALTLTALVTNPSARAVVCHKGDTQLRPEGCCMQAFTVQRVREYDCVNGVWQSTTKVSCTIDACVGE